MVRIFRGIAGLEVDLDALCNVGLSQLFAANPMW